jgi:hypothetical protein
MVEEETLSSLLASLDARLHATHRALELEQGQAQSVVTVGLCYFRQVRQPLLQYGSRFITYQYVTVILN